MLLTNERNRETGPAPAAASHILILGDSIARAFEFGVGGGAILSEIAGNSGLAGETVLINAGFGGSKMMHPSGTDRFLDFASLSEAQALTDAKSIMSAFPAVEAAVICLGVNDLSQVEPAPGAIPGYNQTKIEAGMNTLIAEIRSANIANGHTGSPLPVILLIPGRDGNSTNKAGAAQVWRRAALSVAATDADCHPLDYHDVDLQDSVHPSAAGNMTLGARIGRMIALHAHGADDVGGPPTIQSVSRIDDLTMGLTFAMASGHSLLRPGYPTGWRVESETTGEPLRIARLEWTASNEARLILHDGAGGAFRLFAPYDLASDFQPEGVIRTVTGSDASWPGFVLQSYEGVTP